MPKKTFYILVASMVLFATVFMGMAIGKTRITTVCKDVRLHMDGGYSVNILASGLKRTTTATVYQKRGNSKINLGTVPVTALAVERGAVQGTAYQGSDLQLTVSETNEKGVHGWPGYLKADVAGSRITAKLACNPQ